MKIPLRLAGEPLPPPPGPVVLATGFRPFFLGAAAFAVVGIPLWLVLLTAGGKTGLPGTQWHGHEMVFGYGGAVLAGFLLTAVRHWSGGRATAANGPLALLVLAWLAGRIVHLPGVPDFGVGAALPDVAWLIGITIAIGRPLVAAGSKRNYGFLVALPALAALTIALHLGKWDGAFLLELALMIFVAILAVVGGRIVPLFTRNARPALGVESIAAVEKIVPLGLALVVIAPFLRAVPGARAVFLVIGGGILLARMVRWRALGTRDEPLLWILHVGCWWLPVGLFALAAGSMAWIPAAVGTHALAAGALGSLTIGMLARVSLGHTGRPLTAPRSATVAFVAVVLAGLVRTAAPLFGTPTGMLHASGALWSLGFVAFLVGYARILVTPRADGKPG